MLFLIGAAFGLRRGDRPSGGRMLACAILANAIVGVCIPAYTYIHYPAWMWGYYADPAGIPPAIVAGVFALYWIPFALGYRTHSWRALIAGGIAQLGFIAWQWPRYSTVTTLEGFRAGERVLPSQIPLINAAFPLAVVVLGALLLLARPQANSSGIAPKNAGLS